MPKRRAWIVAAAVVVGACGPKSKPQEEPELLEHRVEPCQKFCTAYVDPTCTEWTRRTDVDMDECVAECASRSGNFSLGWGYKKSTDSDGCVEEWKAVYNDCYLALSCDERALYSSDEYSMVPEDQRPCWQEQSAMLTCEYAEPCCEGEECPC